MSCELHAGSGDVAAHARSQHLSTEAAARQLRYQYFRQLFEEKKLNRIATGHTLDDQAETVLLRIVRGAGTRGLAGIYPQLIPSYQIGSQFSVVRPLLATRRRLLEAYLEEIGQDWREDSSNRDLRHARNRVRHGILPRLERTLNPAVRETLAETADIARAEEEYWQKEVARVLPEVWQAERRTLKPAGLAALPLALRRRVVRAAAESLGLRLEFRHVEEILELAAAEPRSGDVAGGLGAFREPTAVCNSIPRARLRHEFRIMNTPWQYPARFEFRKLGHVLRRCWFRGARARVIIPTTCLIRHCCRKS